MFYVQVIFHCIYISHLLKPVICWWTLRLLPCRGYCKWCFWEHWVHVSFWTSVFLFFLYPGVELLDHMVALFLVFWETSILFSTMATSIYIPTNSVLLYKCSLFSTSLPSLSILSKFIIWDLFDDSHYNSCEVIFYCGFDLHFSDG